MCILNSWIYATVTTLTPLIFFYLVVLLNLPPNLFLRNSLRSEKLLHQLPDTANVLAVHGYMLLDIQLHFYIWPGGSEGEESTCNAGDPGSILGSGRSPGEANAPGNRALLLTPSLPVDSMLCFPCHLVPSFTLSHFVYQNILVKLSCKALSF